MDGMELISFKIISAVGEAKSYYIEAIQKAKAKNFDEANECMKKGQESFLLGHQAHAGLIQQEASGDHVIIGLLLMHAEDQLMAAETVRLMAEEMIEIHQELKK